MSKDLVSPTEKSLIAQENELMEIFKQAVKDAKLFQEGKLTTYPVSELFDEL